MQGSTTFLKYRKSLRKRGGLIGAFSHVHLASGIELACVLRPDDLLKVRACSETYGALVRAAETAKERAAAERRLAETPWVLWEDSMAAKSAVKLQCKALPLSGNDALALAAEIDSRSDAGALDLTALADPDTVRTVVAGDAEPPALQPPQEPEIDLDAMPAQPGRTSVAVAAATPERAVTAAAPARSMAPPPPARRGFDADAFAEQMQRAADKGDSDTLDALAGQLRDVPGEDLRATLTDMYERLRGGAGPAATDRRSAPASTPRHRPGAAGAAAHGALTAANRSNRFLKGDSQRGGARLPPPPTSHPAQPRRCRPFFYPLGRLHEPCTSLPSPSPARPAA